MSTSFLTADEEKELSVITPEFTVSYPHLFEGRPNDDEVIKFSTAMLFDAAAVQTPQWKKLERALQLAAKKKWGPKIPAKLKTPIRTDPADIADKNYSKNVVAFMNASSNAQPGIVDAQVKDITDPKLVYPGVIARAEVRAYAYDTKGNKGVTFGINNIQILRDGPRLDGRKDAKDVFEALEPAELEAAMDGLK